MIVAGVIHFRAGVIHFRAGVTVFLATCPALVIRVMTTFVADP